MQYNTKSLRKSPELYKACLLRGKMTGMTDKQITANTNKDTVKQVEIHTQGYF